MNSKLVLNADDFGLSDYFNRAVYEGFHSGLLTSASLCANGEAFESAVSGVIPNCQGLSVGVHLNIMEGKSLTDAPLLTLSDGTFQNGYISLILKSFNKDFMAQLEGEFRAQIEKVQSRVKVDHIDSHVHTHAIPNIFKLVAKLADEYNIPYIRTQFEKMYFVPSLKKHLNTKYPPNILKIILLNTFTVINRKTVKKYNLKTNDYLIGVGYTGMMDDETLLYGLKAFSTDCIIETLIHPCKYDDETIDSHSKEFLITQNQDLKKEINGMGIEFSNIISLVE